MLEEFKKFAMRGNVVDLAVGVIIGAAFGAIVSSLVADIIMPIIGAVDGRARLLELLCPVDRYESGSRHTARRSQEVGCVLAWGNFLTIVINFLIIAWVLFMVVRGINKLQKKEAEKPAAPAAPTKQEVLLAEIRDILAKKPA